jgi:hypothetical protein
MWHKTLDDILLALVKAFDHETLNKPMIGVDDVPIV